ncbi:MAG TPA: primosomal protein N' [Terriglobales bacterium]|jgi:primosomal protein N' (replication factor Y)|nr:primosomal protein N' [Terriglobales bacterium]
MLSAKFCDVAVPLPLEGVFTYRTGSNGIEPVVGGRVLVPFRNERLAGVVTKLHDTPPSVETKVVINVLDQQPMLDADLLRLGEWISQYYLAPIGEVLRSMLPLAADVKRVHFYRITDLGREVLFKSATAGSSLRAKKTHEEQMEELRVLDYLANRDSASQGSLRAAIGGSRSVLASLLRKKWIIREDASSIRDSRRLQKVATLKPQPIVRATPQQKKIIEALEQNGGRMPLEDLWSAGASRSALQTLVKNGVVEISEEPIAFQLSQFKTRSSRDFELNSEQRLAREKILQSIAARQFKVALLHGVTGSGKTAVYLSAMQSVLSEGRSAILLVPEIGLTPAAAANLHNLFGDEVAILHSALLPDERAEQWRRIRAGDARIIVGTRSAVFAPVRDLALIVVDEEHDSSYKQEETPRYHGRDVAVMRGKLAGAAVVLASATPSLESYHNAQQGRYELIELRQRVEQRPLPEVEIVDMRAEFNETGEDRIFSRQLAQEVRERLERNEQAMILLNRRGYSPVVLCRACGETVQCRNCAIALTHHKRANTLICHYCGYRQGVPRLCPKCNSEHIFFLGTGSEKLEERLHQEFPRARIGRLDRDTVRRREDFERVLSAFDAGELDLLVGTQMIAKGHDVHGVTLVGVVGADFALGFPDFRAAERTFQLLTQVAGRAGRGNLPGKVILQTYFPDHYAIQYAAKHDYDAFCEKEMRFRKWMNYPPFTTVANLVVRSNQLERALQYSGQLGEWFEKNKSKGLRVMGPAAAPIVRLKRDYRYHFVLKSESRERLNGTLRAMLKHAAERKIPRSNLIVDVDAVSLL